MSQDLDLAFYRRQYPDLQALRSPELLWHWKNHGRKEGRFANGEALLEHLQTLYGKLPYDFIPEEYLSLNDDLRTQLDQPWQAAAHYLQHGIKEGRIYTVLDIDFYRDFYDDTKLFTSQEVIKHWCEWGFREGRFANQGAFLKFHGVNNEQWTTLFCPAEYLDLNPDLDIKPSGVETMRHFIEYGIHELRPFSRAFEYDHLFYTEYYQDLTHLSPAAGYKHFLSHGFLEKRIPSRLAFFEKLGLTLTDYPDQFGWQYYLAVHEDLTETNFNRWQALEHFIGVGAGEKRHLDRIDPELSQLYLAAGKYQLTRRGALPAIAAFQKAYLHDQDNFAALLCIADVLDHLGMDFEGLTTYRQIPNEEKTISDRIKEIDLLSRNGMVAQAFDQLCDIDNILDIYIAHPCLRLRITRIIDKHFFALWRCTLNNTSENTVDPFGLDKLVDRIQNIWSTDTALPAKPALLNKPIVFILCNRDLAQCFYYRVLQKSQQLNAAGYDVEIFDEKQVDDFSDGLYRCNVAIFYRMPAFPNIIRAVEMAKGLGIPTVYDMDDLIFDRRYYPDSLASYGGLINSREYVDLCSQTILFQKAMALCEFGMASTAMLAEIMKSYVKKCFVYRNGLNENHQILVTNILENRIIHHNADLTLFYGTGTKAHNEDFNELLAPALSEIMLRHPKVKLIIVGHLRLPAMLNRFISRIRHEPFVDSFSSYLSLLAMADINLAVLKESVLSDCKSEIKWLEAASLSIPSVVSASQVYREVIKEGVDGMLARNIPQWIDQLDNLIRDPKQRRDMGESAREKAFQNYSIEAMIPQTKQIMATIFSECMQTRRKPLILLVNVFFYPQSIGGATRVVQDHVDLLLQYYSEDFDLAVFTTDHGNPKPYQISEYHYRGIRVTRVSTPMEVDMDWRYQNATIGKIFAAYLTQHRPHLVHFHCIQRLTGSIVGAALNMGIPYFITLHDGWWISDHQFLVDEWGNYNVPKIHKDEDLNKLTKPESYARLSYLRGLLSGATVALAVSESFAAIFRGLGFTNVQVNQNGLSLSQDRPRSMRLDTQSDQRVVVGFIGGMAVHKGFRLIKKVFSQHYFDHLSLLIVDDSQPHRSRYYGHWGGNTVEFVGRYPQDKVGHLYDRLDVLLAPSIWPESYGLVTREALSQGIWVITSNRGAIGDDVDEGKNGFIIDVSNHHALVQTLSHINASYTQLKKCVPLKTLRNVKSQVDELAALYKQYR